MDKGRSKQVGEIFHDWRGCCGGSFSVFLTPEVDKFTLTGSIIVSYAITNRKIKTLRMYSLFQLLIYSILHDTDLMRGLVTRTETIVKSSLIISILPRQSIIYILFKMTSKEHVTLSKCFYNSFGEFGEIRTDLVTFFVLGNSMGVA